MSFIWPYMLFSLLLVPLGAGLYLRAVRKRSQASAELGPLGQPYNFTGGYRKIRQHLPPTFFLFSLTLLLFGLARPEMIVELPKIEGTVILAFDVSDSMTADDLEPSRIEAAKTAARAFVENQPATVQLGVVAFGSGGLIVQQPTSDKGDVLAAIDRLSPQGGTSVGKGIFSSLNAISGEALAIDESALEEGSFQGQIGDYPSAAILLLSDGENTEPPDPLEIAQLAAEANVRIYPVGIGSVEGAVLQIDGYNILSQLDESTLEQIASLTNGDYYHAEDEEALQTIYENIDLRLTIKEEMMEITSIIAGLSTLLFLAGGMLSLRWFGRMP
jgi:Ca-activated chloride channel family protein